LDNYPSKPTPDDIRSAITQAETGDWIDPVAEPNCWLCELYTPDGERFGDGNGHTPAEAMALAWLHYWAPDALEHAYVEPDSVPLEVSDDWQFRLSPPGSWSEQGLRPS
jgi:hypothetical protein